MLSPFTMEFAGVELSMMCCISEGRKKTVSPVPLLNTKGV